MIKQLKVYELEEEVLLPAVNYSDWANPVATELAKKGLDFLSRLSLSQEKVYHVSDLIENKPEIVKAVRMDYDNKLTSDYIMAIFKVFSIANDVIEFSDVNDSEDIMVFSKVEKKGSHFLSAYLLRNIMNTVLSEKEILETISRELTNFDYHKLSEIILSEDMLFSPMHLEEAKEEISHALRYKFLSKKTMEYVSFMNKLRNGAKRREKDFIFLVDLYKIPVE